MMVGLVGSFAGFLATLAETLPRDEGIGLVECNM